MTLPKLTKLELQIMEALWTGGDCPSERFRKRFPRRTGPPTPQSRPRSTGSKTRKAVRRVKKISNAHIFEAVVSRDAALGRLIDDLLSLFGGRTQPVMAHLVESGKLTLDDVEETEKLLRKLARKEKPQ